MSPAYSFTWSISQDNREVTQLRFTNIICVGNTSNSLPLIHAAYATLTKLIISETLVSSMSRTQQQNYAI